VSAHKLAIQTIQKLSFTIYFRKSSNTRVPPPLEAPKVIRFTQIRLMLQESIEEQIMPVSSTKGQMLIQVWTVNVLRILRWLILICKMVPVRLNLTIPTLSSKNCIDKLLNLY